MQVVDVDLFGVVYGAEAARPAIKRAGGGAIVVTASLAGLSPMATDPGYSVAKGGAVAFVRSMAPRLDRRGHHDLRDLPRASPTPRSSTRSARSSRRPASRCSPPRRSPTRWSLAWTSGEPGAAYIIQPGIGAVPYRFKGVPSAKTEAGETAVVPEALRPPSMR